MKKVLIVDDEVDLCLMIRLFLTKKNYEVYIAHTLNEGLKKMNSFKPDSLLLDNNLPDGMGWDFAKNIQKQYPEMHITLISAHKGATQLKDELGSGIKILEKPISFNDIEQFL